MTWEILTMLPIIGSIFFQKFDVKTNMPRLVAVNFVRRTDSKQTASIFEFWCVPNENANGLSTFDFHGAISRERDWLNGNYEGNQIWA